MLQLLLHPSKNDSELYFLWLICGVVTLCFYPSCRSHPLCGTLWLRGKDRRWPQLQERRKVPDYQQHVSHYSCLSHSLPLEKMWVSNLIPDGAAARGADWASYFSWGKSGTLQMGGGVFRFHNLMWTRLIFACDASWYQWLSERIGQHSACPSSSTSWLQLRMVLVFLLSTGGSVSECCSDPLRLGFRSGAEAFEEARRMLGRP